MNFKKQLFLLCLVWSILGFSQMRELSPLAKVSLLTVGTADELSSQFGHTAIRIQDPTTNFDTVLGYGGFDFEDPNFYFKFTTGKLDYSMTASRYDRFIARYKIEKRWVQEQTLNLTHEQKNTLFAFLQNNYREENRTYKYDFLFDNCATKIPEVFSAIYNNSLNFDSSYIKKTSTFRQLIHETLDTNSWSTFGIDLALGAVIDRKASAWEHQFLPLYVQQQFRHIKIDGVPLVGNEKLVLDVPPLPKKNNFFLSPLFFLLVLLLITVFITYTDHKKQRRSRWLDFSLFLVTGIVGLLITFLWFATDHSSTKLNFNILWAFAPNLFMIFLMLKKQLPLWFSKYVLLLLIGIAITIILWLFGIQIFSPLLIIILISLGLRYLFLFRFKQNKFSTH